MSSTVVVVGIDGSPASIHALRTACDYARLLEATLRVVTTWNHVAYEEATGVWDPERDAKEIGPEALRSVFADEVPEWISTTTRLGPAGEALVHESRHADLLVVGSRGRNALAGLVLGSVSAHCAEQAECPVLIVHEHDHAPLG